MILFSLPDWEPAVQIGTKFIKELAVPFFEDPWILEGDAADRDTFYYTVDSENIRYISFLGHGDETTATGQYYSVILQKGDFETARIAKDKIFNLLSCSVGKELAPWMVEQGAKAVFAYTEDFIFSADYEQRLFFKPHCKIDETLSNNKTTGEAFKRSIEEWNRSYEQASEWAKPWARWDRDHLELFGGKDVTIWDVPEEPPDEPGDEPEEVSRTIAVLLFAIMAAATLFVVLKSIL
jgi:hypothetical protein